MALKSASGDKFNYDLCLKVIENYIKENFDGYSITNEIPGHIGNKNMEKIECM